MEDRSSQHNSGPNKKARRSGHITIGLEDYDDDEKTGIARIQLRLPLLGMTAVVAGYYDANRVLTAWKKCLQSNNVCEYAILFNDGASIRGTFLSSSEVKGSRVLSRIVRMALGLDAQTFGLHSACILVDRFGNAVTGECLNNYALD